MVGVNVPIPVPMAFYSFGGWKDSLFGDHHIHGPGGRALLHARQGGHDALARGRVRRRQPPLPDLQLVRRAALLFILAAAAAPGSAQAATPTCAGPPPATTRLAAPVTYEVSCFDVEEDQIAIRLVSVENGTALVMDRGDGTAQVTYTPAAAGRGIVTVAGTELPGNVTGAPSARDITVTPNARPACPARPVGHLPPGGTAEVPSGCTDADAFDVLAYAVLTGPQYGTVELDAAGVARYRAAPGFAGSDRFTLRVTDGALSVDLPRTVHVGAGPVCDPVTPAPTTTTAVTLTPFCTTLAGTVALSVLTPPRRGDVSVAGTAVTYTPREGEAGDDVILLRPRADGVDGPAFSQGITVVAAATPTPTPMPTPTSTPTPTPTSPPTLEPEPTPSATASATPATPEEIPAPTPTASPAPPRASPPPDRVNAALAAFATRHRTRVRAGIVAYRFHADALPAGARVTVTLQSSIRLGAAAAVVRAGRPTVVPVRLRAPARRRLARGGRLAAYVTASVAGRQVGRRDVLRR